MEKERERRNLENELSFKVYLLRISEEKKIMEGNKSFRHSDQEFPDVTQLVNGKVWRSSQDCGSSTYS
jgi:hypothetical protein